MGRPRRAREPHSYQWLPHVQMWRCERCWHCKRRPRHSHDKRPCKGVPDWASRIRPELGHRLNMVMAGEQPLIFCVRCGAYAECRVKLLARQCAGRSGSAYTHFERTIVRGKHPRDRKIPLGVPWLLRMPEGMDL